MGVAAVGLLGTLLGVELPDLHLRSDLLAAGFADEELRRLLRAGELTAVRRGAYVRGAPPDDVLARHVLAVRAAVENLADSAVVSHVSAAVLHGLPLWAVPLDRVHVTKSRRSGGRTGSRVRVHTASLDAGDVGLVTGLPVTSLARTVADLARTLPFPQAVALADGAMFVKR